MSNYDFNAIILRDDENGNEIEVAIIVNINYDTPEPSCGYAGGLSVEGAEYSTGKTIELTGDEEERVIKAFEKSCDGGDF